MPTKIAGRPRLTTLKPSRTLGPLAAFMDFFTLAIIVFIAIYLLKTQQQRRHTLLLAQYLVSRSHKSGGLTLEGRYTLAELFVRLRNSGYLRTAGVHTHNPGDALEQLLNSLSGGETALKFYYIVDRRDFLEKVKAVRLLKPPKPKAAVAMR